MDMGYCEMSLWVEQYRTQRKRLQMNIKSRKNKNKNKKQIKKTEGELEQHAGYSQSHSLFE
jgi:transposase